MGYISHPKHSSSCMIVFWQYHAKWVDVYSNSLCRFHPWNYADVSTAQHHLFACWLLSKWPALTMLLMLLLCVSLFPLSHDALPPLFSIDLFNLSTIKFVASVEFSKASSSSTITRFHRYCSFFNVFRMKWMIHTGDYLYTVGNTHGILVFLHQIVSMEMNSRMEVTF